MTRQKNLNWPPLFRSTRGEIYRLGFFGYSYIRRASAAKKGRCNVAFSRPPSVCIEISCEAVVNSTLCHLLQMECSLDSSTTENSPLCNVLSCVRFQPSSTLSSDSPIMHFMRTPSPAVPIYLSPFRTCQKTSLPRTSRSISPNSHISRGGGSEKGVGIALSFDPMQREEGKERRAPLSLLRPFFRLPSSFPLQSY